MKGECDLAVSYIIQEKMQLRDYIENKTSSKPETDLRTRIFLDPVKISYHTPLLVFGEQNLLIQKSPQITLIPNNACKLSRNGSIILDFGVEIFGGINISIFHGSTKDATATIRLRFGESLTEVSSDLGGEQNSTNDHSVRDSTVCVGVMASSNEFGNTGFRFVRIDLLDQEFIMIKSIRAVLLIRDIEYKGSFECNDNLLNKIWQTAAYTAHLNMQDYMLDGIKRDKLVWIGDMGPETATIQCVFGFNEVVPKSLLFVRDETPLPEWMNGIASYSMWWIIILYDWHMQNSDTKFLVDNQNYLTKLCKLFEKYIDDNGNESTDGMRFFDWPTKENEKGTDAGIHALLTYAIEKAQKLFEILNDKDMKEFCNRLHAKLIKCVLETNDSKQAQAFQVLAGIRKLPVDGGVCEGLEALLSDSTVGMSTFLGYYVLIAKAKEKDITRCLNILRNYWGRMLELGATTFWEDFDTSWALNANRIDELPLPGQEDIHGDKGNHCYKGFRHSLCHGWASGPAPFLSHHVLGIKIIDPGCKTIRIKPELGDLEWAKGTYPTPYGIIEVSHTKLSNGEIKTHLKVPPEICVQETP